MPTATFSYDEVDRAVAQAIQREKAGNFSAYIRRLIKEDEARSNGRSIESRLAAIEELLREGIVAVMPDQLSDNEQDQIFDDLLEAI